jgi:hypothetical protein
MGCLFILFAILRAVVAWLVQIISSIGQWTLGVMARAVVELGKRWWAIGSFVPAGPEEGVAFGALAELSAGLTMVISTGVILAVLITTLAPLVLPWIEWYHNEDAYRAYLSQIQSEILSRGGAYPSLPPDLGRGWRPGPEEQERLKGLANLSVAPPTSAGSGPPSADDQVIDDLKALVGGNASPGIPAPGSPVHTSGASGGFNEGALQAARLAALGRGDVLGYNRLIEEHRALYKQHGIDPCKSSFFPQGCQ